MAVEYSTAIYNYFYLLREIIGKISLQSLICHQVLTLMAAPLGFRNP